MLKEIITLEVNLMTLKIEILTKSQNYNFASHIYDVESCNYD